MVEVKRIDLEGLSSRTSTWRKFWDDENFSKNHLGPKTIAYVVFKAESSRGLDVTAYPDKDRHRGVD